MVGYRCSKAMSDIIKQYKLSTLIINLRECNFLLLEKNDNNLKHHK